MASYAVLEGTDKRYEAVKIGFSFWAFLFTWLWAFVSGVTLWICIALLAVDVCIGSIASNAAAIAAALGLGATAADGIAVVAGLAALAFRVWVGLNGNAWKRSSRLAKGFQVSAEPVTARNEEEAVTSARPELVKENALVSKALLASSHGRPEDAKLIYERILREYPDDSNVSAFAREALAGLSH